tara:strand:- start:10290 stop:10553 length:264 start_codon:yes stop_codon:yes gene_type:complete
MAKISTYDAAGTPALVDKVIGTEIGATPENATKNYSLLQLLTLFNANSVPPSTSSAGTKGQIAVDAGYLYICTDKDTWARVALSSWV